MPYKKEWFNDESFWEHYAPIMFDSAHWTQVPLVADALTHLARLDLYGENNLSRPAAGGPHILDICCGFGRITAELARRGFSACGVDITEAYLTAAREDAVYENLAIEYVKADARSFIRPDFFDAAVNLYISFGYFENPEDDFIMIRNVYESLKPGGAFIIETLGKEIAVRDFVEAEWFEKAGFTVLTEYAPYDSWAGLTNRWILIKDGQRIERKFTQRLYSGVELRSLLYRAGFSSVEIFGDWDESAYDHHADKLIAVGRK